MYPNCRIFGPESHSFPAVPAAFFTAADGVAPTDLLTSVPIPYHDRTISLASPLVSHVTFFLRPFFVSLLLPCHAYTTVPLYSSTTPPTPQGLRAYLRAAVQSTYSKAVVPYLVHELTDVPYLHGDHFSEPEPIHVNIARDVRYCHLLLQQQALNHGGAPPFRPA